MSVGSSARDGFTRYYAEKLWQWIPAVYRHEDGQGPTPGSLRALVEVIAGQAAILRRSQDRVWEDQFIESCDDWAVPYLADLVGTRLVAALNRRGRRVDVAKTIYYRRRKGTLPVVEELVSDIAGWEGKAVETFRRLARTRHGLDPHPAPLSGRYSGTLPGGWADLRRTRGAALTGGPFDEYHHTPDVRRHRGGQGRYSIPKVAFHLYRLGALRVDGVMPHPLGDGRRFTFDPSGRDIPLFMPRGRRGSGADWSDWQTARPWELPAPLTCHLLSDPESKPELVPNALRIDAPAGSPIDLERVLAGRLDMWTTAATDGDVVVDPGRGRLMFLSDQAEPVSVAYHVGVCGELGAGSFARREVEDRLPDTRKRDGDAILPADFPREGVVQIEDSATYSLANPENGIADLTIQAANGARPYLDLQTAWVMDANASSIEAAGDAVLTLDGLWIGGGQDVVLRGDYERVTLRHCTLDPGGRISLEEAERRAPVRLVVEGHAEEVLVEDSILGPVVTRGVGLIEKLIVRDSIVQDGGEEADTDAAIAISLGEGEAELTRVTLFGGTKVKRLSATETLSVGTIDVTDTQRGCFRFSAAPLGSRLPRPFESVMIAPNGWRSFFVSRRFGDPGLGQLSEAAPASIRTGAENGSEIGAFTRLIAPIRRAGLETKVFEYLPFGLIPIFINET